MQDHDAQPRPQWALAPPAPDDVVDALALPRLWAQLLYNRGILTRDDAWAQLHVSQDSLHDPYLFADMAAAVARVLQAVDDGESVAVFGDFDTDGVTAAAILYEAVGELGGDAFVHLPHRVLDGHGLNAEAIDAIAEQGAGLIITVDCGITSAEEVRQAKRLGMDVILTDHHAPLGAPPEAYATVTPTGAYPFHHLTGAGLAFKLVQALHAARPLPDLGAALELAALGTVADMAPLLGENRSIASLGLDHLRTTTRLGLLTLLQSAGVDPADLDHESIPFVIAPRINAAGRMDSPELAFDLLTATDPWAANGLAQRIEALNRERRTLTQELVAEGLERAAGQADAESLLFIEGERFHPSVSGLVAGRLAERYARPAVVVAVDGDVARASGRSVAGFDLAEAFARCGELFLHFGGHPAAAGFVARAEDLDAIRRALQDIARGALAGAPAVPTLRVDAEVQFNDLTAKTMDFLQRLAPFGQGNPQPALMSRGVEVAGVESMGREGRHARLQLRQDGAAWEAVAFSPAWPRSDAQGRVDIVFVPEYNTYAGRTKLQLKLLDLRPAA